MGDEYIYFGIDPVCGHTVAAVVDTPEHKRDTAKTVAGFIREGYTVVRQKDQAKMNWCSEQCPRMIEVRAKQARKKVTSTLKQLRLEGE